MVVVAVVFAVAVVFVVAVAAAAPVAAAVLFARGPVEIIHWHCGRCVKIQQKPL